MGADGRGVVESYAHEAPVHRASHTRRIPLVRSIPAGRRGLSSPPPLSVRYCLAVVGSSTGFRTHVPDATANVACTVTGLAAFFSVEARGDKSDHQLLTSKN